MSQLDTLARRHSEIIRDSLSAAPTPRLEQIALPDRRWTDWNRPVPRLLVAAIAVMLLIVVPLIVRSPRPAVDVPPPADSLLPSNGLIILMGADVELIAVDQDGVSRSAELKLPTVGEFARSFWSPDGRELLYSDERGVSVFDTVNGTERQLGLQECSEPFTCSFAWSPDGSQIALLDSGVLKLLDPHDGTTIRSVGLPEMSSDPFHVIWSSTGDWLILGYVFGEHDSRLIGIHPDGSEVTTFYQGDFPTSFAWSSELEGVVVLAGTRVEPDPGSDFANLQLSVFVSRPGVEPQHIIDVGRCACLGLYPGLATSPDGSLIAMNVPGIGASASPNITKWGLYIMAIDGSDLHRIGDAGLGDPVWQPIP